MLFSCRLSDPEGHFLRIQVLGSLSKTTNYLTEDDFGFFFSAFGIQASVLVLYFLISMDEGKLMFNWNSFYSEVYSEE
jgi:hypothetical protein